MIFDRESNVLPGSGGIVLLDDIVRDLRRGIAVFRSFHGRGRVGSDSWWSFRDRQRRATRQRRAARRAHRAV